MQMVAWSLCWSTREANLPANTKRWALRDTLTVTLMSPQPPLCSAVLSRGALLMLSPTAAGGAATSFLAVWLSALEPWMYLHSFAFRRSDCNRNRNICRDSKYINTAFVMDNCYHANETSNFHFPHEALPQLHHSSNHLRECRNAILRSPVLFDIFYTYTFMWQAALMRCKSNLRTLARGHSLRLSGWLLLTNS